MASEEVHCMRGWMLTICFCATCLTSFGLGGCFIQNYYDVKFIEAGGKTKVNYQEITNVGRIKEIGTKEERKGDDD